MKPRVLGLSATLRNARSKAGSRNLLDEINTLETAEDLAAFIDQQAKIHLDQYMKSGRERNAPFDELYRELKSLGGLRGLSNSEVCLAAALWGARHVGAELDYASLADHFPADGSEVNLDELKAKLRAADGILLASPVYFGDRSSLSQRLIEMIRADKQLCADLAGKVYGGIAVGAKRNGGQETTLIYQILDMVDIGLLAVGNDSDTTSQYGGTAHAGDIGTIPKDKYGIETSVGTGRRVARVALLRRKSDHELTDKLRMGLWVLQDKDGALPGMLGPFLKTLEPQGATLELNLIDHAIRPCIACDICPTHVGPDEEYRCIIRSAKDGLVLNHERLLEPDVLIPAVYSPRDRSGLKSIYQQFMERTRYLRRGDYVFTDRLVAPLVFAEIGANEHLDVRMITSFIRHHTVVMKPIVGWIHDGKLLNADEVAAGLRDAMGYGRDLLVARLAAVEEKMEATAYNPVGYVLSSAKDKEAKSMDARRAAVEGRQRRLMDESATRLSHSADAMAVAKAR